MDSGALDSPMFDETSGISSEEEDEDEDDDDSMEGDVFEGFDGFEEEVDEDGMDSDETGSDTEPSRRAPVPHRNGKKKLDYLPDHLFEAALSQRPPPVPVQPIRPAAQKPTLKKKKRKTGATSKDLIVGSKTIRTLPTKPTSTLTAAVSRTRPSSGANKFLKRTLALKAAGAEKAKRNGWERRAANVGSMRSRSNLPAVHFARKR